MKVETIVKASIVLLALVEGCGFKLGDTAVVGTTGFLAESNRGLKRTQMKDWDYYSSNEKQTLDKEVNK